MERREGRSSMENFVTNFPMIKARSFTKQESQYMRKNSFLSLNLGKQNTNVQSNPHENLIDFTNLRNYS